MDNNITINTHVYGLRQQNSTQNVRSSTVSGVVYLATTGHLDSKQGGASVTRTVRKITKPCTITENGVSRIVNAEVSLVYVVPQGASTSDVTAANAELMSWAGQESFLNDVISQQI